MTREEAAYPPRRAGEPGQVDLSAGRLPVQDPERTLQGPEGAEDLSEERLEEIRRRRFQARVQRVLAVMQQERIDWRGIAVIGPDGRIGVRVVPMEMDLSAVRQAGLSAGRMADPPRRAR